MSRIKNLARLRDLTTHALDDFFDGKCTGEELETVARAASAAADLLALEDELARQERKARNDAGSRR